MSRQEACQAEAYHDQLFLKVTLHVTYNYPWTLPFG
jgi:hypothetical protein